MIVLLLLACTAPPEDGDVSTPSDTAGDDTGADTATDGGLDPRFQPLADAIAADLEGALASGASVAVWEDGVVTFAAGFGSAHPDREEPIATTTLFQIGSTTKMLTATGLLQKAQAGEVGLQSTVADVLPDLQFALDPTWTSQITMHHLLSHQGGFYDWIAWDGTDEDASLRAYTYDTFAPNFWLMAPPGSFWNYANPNFTFAGLVTETVDDDARMWPDVLTEDVLRPLGMERAYTRRSEVVADGDAAAGYGYVNVNTGRMGTVEVEEVYDPAWARPAGMVWATPTEMLDFAAFLVDGDAAVLDDALRAELTAPQVWLNYLPGSWYGYGVMVDDGFWIGGDWYEVPMWSHGGNTLSYTSHFHVLPEQRFAISILSNGYGDDFTASVATAIATLVELPAPAADPPAWEIDLDAIDAHVGTYVDDYNVGEVTIAREGDTLTIRAPLVEQYGYEVDPELVAVGTDVFYVYIDGVPYDLTFIDAADGTPSAFIRNRAFVATRAAEETTAARPVGGDEARVREALARWRAESAVTALRLPPGHARRGADGTSGLR